MSFEKRSPANAALRARVDEILQKHQKIRDELAHSEQQTLALVRQPQPIQSESVRHAHHAEISLQPDELQALRQVSSSD